MEALEDAKAAEGYDVWRRALGVGVCLDDGYGVGCLCCALLGWERASNKLGHGTEENQTAVAETIEEDVADKCHRLGKDSGKEIAHHHHHHYHHHQCETAQLIHRSNDELYRSSVNTSRRSSRLIHLQHASIIHQKDFDVKGLTNLSGSIETQSATFGWASS